MEQQNWPAVLLLNIMRNNKLLLLQVVSFGMVCYTTIDNWNSMGQIMRSFRFMKGVRLLFLVQREALRVLSRWVTWCNLYFKRVTLLLVERGRQWLKSEWKWNQEVLQLSNCEMAVATTRVIIPLVFRNGSTPEIFGGRAYSTYRLHQRDERKSNERLFLPKEIWFRKANRNIFWLLRILLATSRLCCFALPLSAGSTFSYKCRY